MLHHAAGAAPRGNEDDLLRGAARIAQLILPRRLRIPCWISLHELGDDRLQLASPSLSYTLSHPLFVDCFRAMLPLLHGAADTQELVEAAAVVAEPSTSLFLLKVLFANGIVYAADVIGQSAAAQDPNKLAHADFFANFTSEPALALAHAAAATIWLAMPAHLAPAMQDGLADFGFAHAELIDTSASDFLDRLDEQFDREHAQTSLLLVAALDAPSRRFFTHINQLCLRHGTRWLHIEIHGPKVTLGPCIVPYQSACYTCYRYRSASHLPYRVNPDEDTEFSQAHLGQHAGHGPLWRLALAHAALECARLITGFASPTTIGRCNELKAHQTSIGSFEVFKLPRCPSCGQPFASRNAAQGGAGVC